MSSSSIPRPEMAPKRKRMMEMVVALGGLREEEAIPLSRVNEEIAALQKDIMPLMKEVLEFPENYIKEFIESAEKTNLLEKIDDKGILSEAISKLEKTRDLSDSEELGDLLSQLKELRKKLTKEDTESTTIETIDLDATLKPIPDLVERIIHTASQLEEKAKADSGKAEDEIKTIVASRREILEGLDADSSGALDALQKLGTKTRYGDFLRTAAQIKRGRREERISEQRFDELLRTNVLLEFHRGTIMYVLNNIGSKTVMQLADILELPSETVQRAIVTMIQRGDVEMVGLDRDAPVFARVLTSTPQSTLIVKQLVQQLRGLNTSIEGVSKLIADEALADLERVLKRLQLLGEYDETDLSEPINELNRILSKATETALMKKGDIESEDLRRLVSAGLEAFTRFRLKITLEKGPQLIEGTNVYGEKLDPDTYQSIMDTYLENELERGIILILIREYGAMSVKDLAEKTRIPKDRILQHLLRMKRDELLTLAGEDHGYVLYDVPRLPNEAELTLQIVSDLTLQMLAAKKNIETMLQELNAKDIGQLVNSLENISKARDRLTKIEMGGSVVAEKLLEKVEERIKSAVLMAYRTRARIPSTRPKITIEDLMDVDVPSVLDEYREQMGYAPLLGFGTIHWEVSKCLGCKSCEISCPEDAIKLKPVIDIPSAFGFDNKVLDTLPVNKALFWRTVHGLATTKPEKPIVLDKEAPGFGEVDVDLWLCVACRTCVRRCPGPEDGALELELKWNLPEVVRQMTAGAN